MEKARDRARTVVGLANLRQIGMALQAYTVEWHDELPTGYHGAYTAGVGPGSTVYIAGAGPVTMRVGWSGTCQPVIDS